MKKLIVLLLLCNAAIAQNRYHSDLRATLGLLNEPGVFFDHKVSLGIEAFFSEGSKYIHPTITTVSKIEGGYVDVIVGLGYYKSFGNQERFDIYAGPRLGAIYRGRIHPTAGLEIGGDVKLTNSILLGFRITGGWRSDFEFWGGKPEFRNANFAKLSIIL